MTPAAPYHPDPAPNTRVSLAADLAALGLRPGDTAIVHSSLSALGWTVGGAETVIHALLDVLGPAGTLMMPAHTSNNSDPARWSQPPVPETWWPVIRDHTPAYDPARTPTRKMGAVAELFRTWPGVLRSAHPMGSYTAHGPHAAALVAEHPLEHMLDDRSPLGALYRLGGRVLLLGVGHANNSSLHLAEAHAEMPHPFSTEQAAVMIGGERVWATWQMHDFDDEDFATFGAEYERDHAGAVTIGRVGAAETRLMEMRPLVDSAAAWFPAHRVNGLPPRAPAEAPPTGEEG
jgi:aminoglycoside 3-N-acetyltransferase